MQKLVNREKCSIWLWFRCDGIVRLFAILSHQIFFLCFRLLFSCRHFSFYIWLHIKLVKKVNRKYFLRIERMTVEIILTTLSLLFDHFTHSEHRRSEVKSNRFNLRSQEWHTRNEPTLETRSWWHAHTCILARMNDDRVYGDKIKSNESLTVIDTQSMVKLARKW